MKLYGEYLKKLNQYGTPYGMIPAGIYHISEAEDKEVFEVVHPHADFEVRKRTTKSSYRREFPWEADTLSECFRYGSLSEEILPFTFPWEKRLPFWESI